MRLLTGSDSDGDAFESSTSYGFYVGKLEPRAGRVRGPDHNYVKFQWPWSR